MIQWQIAGLVLVVGLPCIAIGWWLRTEQYRAHWRAHIREWQRWQDANIERGNRA